MFHDQQRQFRSAVAHHPVVDAVRPVVHGRETCPAMMRSMI